MASAPSRGFLARIMMRKSVEQIQQETATSELKRSLGPWNLVFLGIGCIIGAGIFVRTGNAAALHAGPAVLISFVDRRRRLRASPASAMPSSPRPCRSRARPIPTAMPRSASSPPGSWARCCCSNMASPPRSSRSAGRAIWSACSAISASTYRPQLTGPAGLPCRGRRRRARRRRDRHLHLQPAGLPRLPRARRCCWSSASPNRPSSTTSSSRSR